MILKLVAILWWPVTSAKENKGLLPPEIKKDLLTPLREYGEACGYESCPLTKPGHLNVHIVATTHMELGYSNNIDEHYTGEDEQLLPRISNAEKILDTVLTELWNNDNRKFTLSDTAYLFHWWVRRDAAVRRMVYQLIRQGRLFLVGGGFSMSDEASVSYQAIIDHFTYSLRKINATFMECGRPLVAWQADVYGHSKEFTSLMAQMGFDGLFINPMSYDDEAARMRRLGLEFLWRGSDELGQDSDIFTHKLFDGYWPPPGFCFGKLCTDPLLITSDSVFKNYQERIDLFIQSMRFRQAPNYATKHVMVTMGHKFAYFDAATWYHNIETLMDYVNKDGVEKGLNISVFYSSPPCYLQSVNEENPPLETKQDDFFPLVYDAENYLVGMYSSRPTLKYIVREGFVYLMMAKQLQVTANLGSIQNYDQFFESFMWILSIMQDHGVVTGSLRDRVKNFYVSRLYHSVRKTTDLMSKAFWRLRNSTVYIHYARCMFNISSCNETRYIRHTLQIYNPLGWPVSAPVRLPCIIRNSKFNVYDNNGDRVKSVLMKTAKPILSIKGRTNTNREVVFIAEDIPPIGFRSYFVEADYWDGSRRKRSIKNVKKTNSKRFHIRQINPLKLEDEQKPLDDETMDYEMFNEPPLQFNASDRNVGNMKGDSDYEYELLKYTPPDIFKNMSGISVKNPFEEEIAVNVTGEETEAAAVGSRIGTITTNKVTTEKASAHRVAVTVKATTHRVAVTDKVTTQRMNTVQVATPKLTTEKSATDKVTTEEINTEQVNTEQVNTREVTTEEVPADDPNNELTTNETKLVDFTERSLFEYVHPNTTANATSQRKYFEVDKNRRNAFIGNKYIRLNLNSKNRIAGFELCNGLNISLDVQLYYYVSDDPQKLNRGNVKSPGIFTFRPMDPQTVPMDTDYEVEVIKNDIVEELHIKFNDWAFLIVRLYVDSSVVEMNWLVGPIPITDELGKDVFIKYSTDLGNEGVFYTDSNGRQTIKRIRDRRATYEPLVLDGVAGNLYPVTSKIYIEDIKKNIRFSVFNDRSQAGGSLNDGNIDLMIHRRILTEDIAMKIFLNETEHGEGIRVLGTHYLYLTKADYKKNRIFEKMLAKEIELAPKVLVSHRKDFRHGDAMKEEYNRSRNEFSALKKKLPVGVHLLTLEKWSENILIRLENYLERADVLRTGVKKVYLKKLFTDIEIISIKETTLGANMYKDSWVPRQWLKKEKFFRDFNENYGNVENYTFEEDYVPDEEDSLEAGILLKPQQIRTFVAAYKYRGK